MIKYYKDNNICVLYLRLLQLQIKLSNKIMNWYNSYDNLRIHYSI